MTKAEILGELHEWGGPGKFVLGRAQDAAELLKEEYAAKVRLIYLDPPFGTGDTFSVKAGPKGKKTAVPAYSDRLSEKAYLEMMRQVLELCRDLLTPDGSVYLHVDYRMAAQLRLLMDDIFGKKNFVNEIIWAYKSGGRAKKHFPRKHDNILVYGKSARRYFSIDSVGIPRGPERRNHMKRHVDETGRISYSIRSGGKLYKYYEDALVYPSDVWTDIEHLHQRDPERTGYSTQKPEALLRRIILASSKEGDIVADLFSGSGTTAATAAKLNRRWLAVDASQAALMILRKRMLQNHSDATLFTQAHGMEIQYAALPQSMQQPDISAVRNGKNVVFTPEDDSIAYIAAGTVQAGVFHVKCCDTEPAKGKSFTVEGEKTMLQVSDLYGNIGIWEY